jgi:fatty acid-binding protein DegV
LRIKPLIYVRPDTGTVSPAIPSRSRKAALEDLHREFFRHVRGDGRMHIAVLHSNAPEETQTLAERVRSEYPQAEIMMSIAAPVLGVHAGPRAVALVGYAEG